MKTKLSTLFATLIFCFSASLIHAQTGKSNALEMLGQLGGIHLYNTYSVIGMAGDGYEEEVYEADFVEEIMDEQVNSMKSISDGYKELLNSGFLTDKSDVDFVKEIETCIGMLTEQAQALKAYVKDNTTENADKFQNLREKSWEKISDLLGLGDK